MKTGKKASEPELEQSYVLIHVEEPQPEIAARMLEAWSRDQAESRERVFTKGALEQSLYLTHRFLAQNRLPGKVFDLLGQLGSLGKEGRPVTEIDVIDRFCTNHKMPRALIDPGAPLNLADLETNFARRVLGQQEAIDAVMHMISPIKAGLSDMRRPFGVFLFAGPTRAGKTHIAQLLAEYLFGGKDRMVRLNMADYPNDRDAALLFGDPGEYGLQERRGLLTRQLMGRPFTVLLLDEFEKAHPKIHDRFLQLIDEGCFVNVAGETISCRSSIIIATTNAGAELYRTQAFGFAVAANVEGSDHELDRPEVAGRA